ncbi:hypothetical protein AGMMS50218_11370 [Actinomycetota bacterium]|nr:hypothetical protein AGMMS50218_11370 [Actinomycetota bacterium]
MRSARQCSRTACSRPAVATLTYVYADSTAVLGPLAHSAEPHSYDLCTEHASRLTAPRGWEVVRLTPEFIESGPSHDDLVALADAVREAGRPPEPLRSAAVAGPAHLAPASTLAESEAPRRGHLRILRGDEG